MYSRTVSKSKKRRNKSTSGCAMLGVVHWLQMLMVQCVARQPVPAYTSAVLKKKKSCNSCSSWSSKQVVVVVVVVVASNEAPDWTVAVATWLLAACLPLPCDRGFLQKGSQDQSARPQSLACEPRTIHDCDRDPVHQSWQVARGRHANCLPRDPGGVQIANSLRPTREPAKR